MYKAPRGTSICDLCKLEDYNSQRSQKAINDKKNMFDEETVETPEEEVTEETPADEEEE